MYNRMDRTFTVITMTNVSWGTERMNFTGDTVRHTFRSAISITKNSD